MTVNPIDINSASDVYELRVPVADEDRCPLVYEAVNPTPGEDHEVLRVSRRDLSQLQDVVSVAWAPDPKCIVTIDLGELTVTDGVTGLNGKLKDNPDWLDHGSPISVNWGNYAYDSVYTLDPLSHEFTEPGTYELSVNLVTRMGDYNQSRHTTRYTLDITSSAEWG